MSESAKNTEGRLEGTEKACSKEAYSAPRLVEYGSFTKLTQGGSLPGSDMTPASPACL